MYMYEIYNDSLYVHGKLIFLRTNLPHALYAPSFAGLVDRNDDSGIQVVPFSKQGVKRDFSNLRAHSSLSQLGNGKFWIFDS